MNKRSRYIVSVAGVISAVIGVMGAIPSFLIEKPITAAVYTLLTIIGLVLLAISFGD